jgi:protocatechuate 3,4-dioxygenase beta subunit
MKVAAILPFLALLPGTLRAQTPAAKPGSVEGVVINSVTGEPVKKAVVTLGETNPTAVMTNADGHFHFDNVTPGTYLIAAQRDGFHPPAVLRLPRLSITVAPERHVQDIAIKLMPLGIIRGHVLDEDGDPIVRAQVAVLRYFYDQGRKQLNQLAFLQTNDLGEFEALNLPPGRYYLQAVVWPPRNIPPHTRWGHSEEAYPAIFYPNVRDVGQATAIDVAPGAHVSNIDFRMQKMPAYHIRGTVLGGAGGQPGTLGQVSLGTPESNLEANVAESNIQPDGGFDVRGVVGGSYRLSFTRFAADAAFSYPSLMVRIADADVNDVVLAPKPDVNVSGIVTVEGSRIDKLQVQISLMARNSMGGTGSGPVGPDEKFTMQGVPPGVFQVQISNVPAGKYVKSIRFGDREVKSGEIDLSEGGGASLNIVLGEDSGEVDGNVQTAGGQPAASTEVTLAPVDEYSGRFDLLKRARTDASGNFHIKDVAPGEYKVFAWENETDSKSQSAEFRKPFDSKSSAVTVGPKDRASVQVIAITVGDIEKEMSKLP